MTNATAANTETETEFRGFTRAALRQAFDRIANPGDWKKPINTVIDASWSHELIDAAVAYYTATEPRFIPVLRYDNGRQITLWKVTAPGYRNGPLAER